MGTLNVRNRGAEKRPGLKTGLNFSVNLRNMLMV